MKEALTLKMMAAALSEALSDDATAHTYAVRDFLDALTKRICDPKEIDEQGERTGWPVRVYRVYGGSLVAEIIITGPMGSVDPNKTGNEYIRSVLAENKEELFPQQSVGGLDGHYYASDLIGWYGKWPAPANRSGVFATFNKQAALNYARTMHRFGFDYNTEALLDDPEIVDDRP